MSRPRLACVSPACPFGDKDRVRQVVGLPEFGWPVVLVCTRGNQVRRRQETPTDREI